MHCHCTVYPYVCKLQCSIYTMSYLLQRGRVQNSKSQGSSFLARQTTSVATSCPPPPGRGARETRRDMPPPARYAGYGRKREAVKKWLSVVTLC